MRLLIFFFLGCNQQSERNKSNSGKAESSQNKTLQKIKEEGKLTAFTLFLFVAQFLYFYPLFFGKHLPVLPGLIGFDSG